MKPNFNDMLAKIWNPISADHSGGYLMYIWSKQDVDNTVTIVCTGSTIRTYYTTTVLVNYRTWENFRGVKVWRISASKAFGVEKFGESALSQSKNPTLELVSSVSVSSAC